MKNISLLILSFIVGIIPQGNTQETVSFHSLDGLEISADIYALDNSDAPIILLCHQAGWSRGEYIEIAPKLNALGYGCVAIDQRSGRTINDISNETHKRANEKDLGTNYLDAKQDITAGLQYVNENFANASKVILWGSSYSSALAIQIATENEIVDAVMSFSPGEYFERFGETDHYIYDAAKKLNKPVFITSARNEYDAWAGIYKVIPSKDKTQFIPHGNGKHGSRTLWEEFPDHQEYWKAVIAFLTTL